LNNHNIFLTHYYDYSKNLDKGNNLSYANSFNYSNYNLYKAGLNKENFIKDIYFSNNNKNNQENMNINTMFTSFYIHTIYGKDNLINKCNYKDKPLNYNYIKSYKKNINFLLDTKRINKYNNSRVL
jgi:hypothetical protein